MSWITEVEKTYKENLIGKQFVYKSKYGGEVFSTVSNIFVLRSVSMDKESHWNVTNNLSKHFSRKVSAPEEEKPTVEKRWSGTRLKIELVSENGNHYNIDETYILN